MCSTYYPGVDLCYLTCLLLSRTIIHSNKNLPELTVNQFRSLIEANLENYSWIHFEGRNKDSIPDMVKILEGSGCPVSVEIEKVGRGYEELIPFGDVVIISKDVAKYVAIYVSAYLAWKLSKSVQPFLSFGKTGTTGRRK